MLLGKHHPLLSYYIDNQYSLQRFEKSGCMLRVCQMSRCKERHSRYHWSLEQVVLESLQLYRHRLSWKLMRLGDGIPEDR